METQKDWKDYFEARIGHGFFSSASVDGQVNIAVYSRPHFLNDGKFYFIVNQGTTSENLTRNPYAAYAFGQGNFQGFRFYLELKDLLESGPVFETVIGESRKPASVGDSGRKKYVAAFTLREVRPLVG